MPMIKIYNVFISVFSKSKNGHIHLQYRGDSDSSLNKQIIRLIKSYKCSPRNEVVDKIIEYAKS